RVLSASRRYLIARQRSRVRARTNSLTSSSRAATISAAAEGVAARTSAAKSAMVTSVSCPMAEMTGICEARIARATSSSLNAHRSSTEPPPRPTMIASIVSFICPAASAAACCAFKSAIARAISREAPAPCTRVGATKTDRAIDAAKTGRAQLRAFIFDREVPMPRRVRLEVGNLALDPDGRKTILQRAAHLRGQLRDRQRSALHVVEQREQERACHR